MDTTTKEPSKGKIDLLACHCLTRTIIYDIIVVYYEKFIY
jgi:hypothetical protein